MILGHITTTFVLREFFLKNYRIFACSWALFLGALLPDIIDKPLALIFGIPGRNFAHSIIILVGFALAFFWVLPWNKKIIVVFLGSCLHLLQDFVELPVLFWPFLGPWPETAPFDFFEVAYAYYFQFTPWVPFVVECLSFPFIAYICVLKTFKKNEK